MTEAAKDGYLDARQEWDSAAARFDEEPDHGLRDPKVRREWSRLLQEWLPVEKTTVLDMGCGTGSLSAIAARLGHTVTGIDFAPRMLAKAQAKTMRLPNPPSFCVMDAVRPAFAGESFGVILARHVLWAVPQRDQVLGRWASLLRPAGLLILIEGNWSTGVGIPAESLIAELPDSVRLVAARRLSDRPGLWGKRVSDERYAIVAHKSA